MKKLVNLKGVRALGRMEQKSINGGNYSCYCNDHYTGQGDSSMDCAGLCSSCVSSGGCLEQE